MKKLIIALVFFLPLLMVTANKIAFNLLLPLLLISLLASLIGYLIRDID